MVTGSSGLIGSEVVASFCQDNWHVTGIDNNLRADFFGPAGDTTTNRDRLQRSYQNFTPAERDIRDRPGVLALMRELRPDAIVHTAAQPSHDLAARRPFDDFDVNAVGTMNLLEAARQFCPESPFVHLSTNKVYGDGPNRIRRKELATRWEFDDPDFAHGVPETFPIDHCLHSLFGASKVAADIMVQEYGRYFGLPTCALRGGCLTGPSHAGVELHGFLSYLVKCNLEQREYTIFGYGGKQVRDNIHAYDVCQFIRAFLEKPRSGEVYNLGGGYDNALSLLEAIALTEEISGLPMKVTHDPNARIGDHICYYSDLRKMRAHYPAWRVTRSLREIVFEIHEAARKKLLR